MATELSNYHWCSSNADGDALSNGHWVIILPFGFIKCLCVIPWPLSHQITIGFHQMPMRYPMTTGFIKLTFESSNADADGHWVIILPLGFIKCRCRCDIQWPLDSLNWHLSLQMPRRWPLSHHITIGGHQMPMRYPMASGFIIWRLGRFSPRPRCVSWVFPSWAVACIRRHVRCRSQLDRSRKSAYDHPPLCT